MSSKLDREAVGYSKQEERLDRADDKIEGVDSSDVR